MDHGHHIRSHCPSWTTSPAADPVDHVDHIDLVVSSLERSLAFYGTFLRWLGYVIPGEIEANAVSASRRAARGRKP